MSLYIDPSSTPPESGRWLHIHQLWQPHDVTGAKAADWGISGAMSFKPGVKEWQLDIVLKSDGRRT